MWALVKWIKSITVLAYLLWPSVVYAHIRHNVTEVLWISVNPNHLHMQAVCKECWNVHTHIQEGKIDTDLRMLHIGCKLHALYTNIQIINACTVGGGDAESESMSCVRALLSSLCRPPWAFCLSREGCSLSCGGRFSSRINEKLHLSHEKSIFTIYLTSCIAKAHIRRCWLILAYSCVFLMHSLPLLRSSVGRLPPLELCPSSLLNFSCSLSGEHILQSWHEIWHTTVNLRKLLKEWI